MRIAVDAMGGDYAPAEIVKGALTAHRQLDDVDIVLVGRPEAIEPYLPEVLPDGFEIEPAEDCIGMNEEPVEAVRRKRRASIRVAMDLVRSGSAVAVVSAGNTGAALAAALLRLKRLPGIDRPAIAALFPTMAARPVMLLDVGANVDSRPKFLEHFAIMGSLYSQYVLGTVRPRVGLLNIGEEPGKGNDQVVTAYKHLQQLDHINFVGNAEGRDILTGDFDVVVCDGFVGNILLKFAESVGQLVTQILKEELPKGSRGKLGSLVLEPNLRGVKRRLDYAEYGGGLLLGVNGICIITHGSSQEAMVCHAIREAQQAVHNRVLERVQTEIVVARETLQRPPGSKVIPLEPPAPMEVGPPADAS